MIFPSSFRDGPKDQTSDAQLRIGNLRFRVRCFASPRNDMLGYGFAGWMKVHGLVSEFFGTSMAMR